jgi:TRAP-type mannitol/chloroaromatic compound transport system permease large subunit
MIETGTEIRTTPPHPDDVELQSDNGCETTIVPVELRNLLYLPSNVPGTGIRGSVARSSQLSCGSGILRFLTPPAPAVVNVAKQVAPAVVNVANQVAPAALGLGKQLVPAVLAGAAVLPLATAGTANDPETETDTTDTAKTETPAGPFDTFLKSLGLDKYSSQIKRASIGLVVLIVLFLGYLYFGRKRAPKTTTATAFGFR